MFNVSSVEDSKWWGDSRHKKWVSAWKYQEMKCSCTSASKVSIQSRMSLLVCTSLETIFFSPTIRSPFTVFWSHHIVCLLIKVYGVETGAPLSLHMSSEVTWPNVYSWWCFSLVYSKLSDWSRPGKMWVLSCSVVGSVTFSSGPEM